MRKRALFFVLPALLIAVSSVDSFAQINGLTDTTKEGSLLIWPRVQTVNGTETYITVSNGSPNEVAVKCFWEVKDVASDLSSPSLLGEFVMQIPGHGALVFRASDGTGLDDRDVAAGMGYDEQGALSCWAVDPTHRKQISWNHLGGGAVIVNADNTAPGVTNPPTTSWEYLAWRFAANVIDSSGKFADGFWVGEVTGVGGADVNEMKLKASPTTVVNPATCPGPNYDAAGCSLPNAAYDACPKYLTFDFLAEPSGPQKTDGQAFNNLALMPCKLDLTGSTLNVNTRLFYTVWNGNGLQVSGGTPCVNAAYDRDLGTFAVLRSVRIFQRRFLHTPSGRFRIEARASDACDPAAVSTPLLGVLSSRLVSGKGTVGSGATASGKQTTDYGYIRWLPNGDYWQLRAQRK